jgi:hypothetical protein
VVTHTGKVLNSTAPDKNNGVFLKVVAYTGDISGNFETVGESYSCDLSLSGVRLLRGLNSHLSANASLLRAGNFNCNFLDRVGASLESGRLGFVGLVLSAVLYQLVECRHLFLLSSKFYNILIILYSKNIVNSFFAHFSPISLDFQVFF